MSDYEDSPGDKTSGDTTSGEPDGADVTGADVTGEDTTGVDATGAPQDPNATRQVRTGDAASAGDPHIPDAATPDAAVPDAATPDSATPDSATPDPVWSSPTDRWDSVAGTTPNPRAYSQVPPAEAETNPMPGTAQFPTGAQTAGFGVDEPPTTGPGVVTSSPRKRGKGKLIGLGAVAVILLIVIGLIGSELYFRNRVTNCLQNQFSSLTGEPVSVSLSRTPVLLQKLSNDYPYVQVDTDDSRAGSMRLHARADQLSQSGDNLKVGSLNGTGFVTFQRVVELSEQGQFGAANPNGGTPNGGTPDGGTGGTAGILSNTQISSVVGDPAAGTIKVDATVQVAIFPVPVSLTMKPVITDGKVTFDVEQASAFIFGIPADFAQQFVDGFGTTLFGDLTNQVTVRSLKVTAQGVDFTVSGHDVELTSADAGSGGGCA